MLCMIAIEHMMGLPSLPMPKISSFLCCVQMQRAQVSKEHMKAQYSNYLSIGSVYSMYSLQNYMCRGLPGHFFG